MKINFVLNRARWSSNVSCVWHRFFPRHSAHFHLTWPDVWPYYPWTLLNLRPTLNTSAYLHVFVFVQFLFFLNSCTYILCSIDNNFKYSNKKDFNLFFKTWSNIFFFKWGQGKGSIWCINEDGGSRVTDPNRTTASVWVSTSFYAALMTHRHRRKSAFSAKCHQSCCAASRFVTNLNSTWRFALQVHTLHLWLRPACDKVYTRPSSRFFAPLPLPYSPPPLPGVSHKLWNKSPARQRSVEECWPWHGQWNRADSRPFSRFFGVWIKGSIWPAPTSKRCHGGLEARCKLEVKSAGRGRTICSRVNASVCEVRDN